MKPLTSIRILGNLKQRTFFSLSFPKSFVSRWSSRNEWPDTKQNKRSGCWCISSGNGWRRFWREEKQKEIIFSKDLLDRTISWRFLSLVERHPARLTMFEKSWWWSDRVARREERSLEREILDRLIDRRAKRTECGEKNVFIIDDLLIVTGKNLHEKNFYRDDLRSFALLRCSMAMMMTTLVDHRSDWLIDTNVEWTRSTVEAFHWFYRRETNMLLPLTNRQRNEQPDRPMSSSLLLRDTVEKNATWRIVACKSLHCKCN